MQLGELAGLKPAKRMREVFGDAMLDLCRENEKVVVGEDRMAAFGWVVNISKGRVELKNAGHRDPLAQGVESVSFRA